MSEEHVKTSETNRESMELNESPKVCSFSIESLLAPSKKPVEEETRVSIQTETYLQGHECKFAQNFRFILRRLMKQIKKKNEIHLNSK